MQELFREVLRNRTKASFVREQHFNPETLKRGGLGVCGLTPGKPYKPPKPTLPIHFTPGLVELLCFLGTSRSAGRALAAKDLGFAGLRKPQALFTKKPPE